jgi:cytoskeletal protein CcmA (bactofilin family)
MVSIKRHKPTIMFKRAQSQPATPAPNVERITSVLGNGIIWNGKIHGAGGVRIEGTFEGEIAIKGMLVVGETGRVNCADLRANTVIVAGIVKGNITAEKLEIRATGRVWGDVTVVAFASEEGAFLRGQVKMEEKVELNLDSTEIPTEISPLSEQASSK